MYSLHDVEIKGISLREVLSCEIQSEVGQHSTLTLAAYVENEDFLYELSDCQRFQVLLKEGERKILLFSGVVTGVKLTEDGRMKKVLVEGKSESWRMDSEKHSRSFQNAEMSYRALVQEILQDYEGAGSSQDEKSDLIFAAEDRAIGSLIVQYQETDWEFLQRVLSLSGVALTPDSRRRGLKLYAGIPALTGSESGVHVLKMDKDMDAYYYLKANGREVYTADFTRYEAACEKPLGILEPVLINGQALVVYSYRYSFETQEMTGFYGLQSPGGLKRTAAYPMHLIGTALIGRVVNVSGAKVQTALEIDGGSEQRAQYWFPYSTPSASADGSGWYCMPEIGDDVRIYFPSKHEKEAVALSAVSSYDTPQDGGEDRMSDPNCRYLRTRSGQELVLAPDHMRISCGGSLSAVTIGADGKVKVRAKATINAEASEEIELHAEEKLSIHVKEQFLLQSLNGGQILSAEDNVFIYGTEVNMD